MIEPADADELKAMARPRLARPRATERRGHRIGDGHEPPGRHPIEELRRPPGLNDDAPRSPISQATQASFQPSQAMRIGCRIDALGYDHGERKPKRGHEHHDVGRVDERDYEVRH